MTQGYSRCRMVLCQVLRGGGIGRGGTEDQGVEAGAVAGEADFDVGVAAVIVALNTNYALEEKEARHALL